MSARAYLAAIKVLWQGAMVTAKGIERLDAENRRLTNEVERLTDEVLRHRRALARYLERDLGG